MQSFWYENDFFYSHAHITHFHKKGFSLSLIWQWEFLELGNGLLIFLLSVVNHPLTVTCWIRFQRHHDNITLWLVKWLAFRLMFCSGIVKLSSRCPTWWGLTALDWHYESQVQLACIHAALERFDCRHLFGKKIYIALVNSGTLHAQYHFKKGDSHSRLDPRDLNLETQFLHLETRTWESRRANQVLRSESKPSTCVWAVL